MRQSKVWGGTIVTRKHEVMRCLVVAQSQRRAAQLLTESRLMGSVSIGYLRSYWAESRNPVVLVVTKEVREIGGEGVWIAPDRESGRVAAYRAVTFAMVKEARTSQKKKAEHAPSAPAAAAHETVQEQEMVFEGLVQLHMEEGDLALSATIRNVRRSHTSVCIQSWDEKAEHTELETLRGRRVRVTVRVLK